MGKSNIKVQIVIISVLLLIIVGSLSYAYFDTQLTKNGSATVNVNASSLKINYADGPNITFNEMLPGLTIIKTFTVSNTGSEAVNYNINMIDVLNELSRTSDLVYTLTATNGGAATQSTQEFPTANTTMFGNVSIASGVTQTYTLTIVYQNLSVDQSVDMGSHINGTIQVVDVSNVISINANNISYSNAANPNVHTVADALDDLSNKLN
ncbi:MAG: hypothetical protein J5892_03860 [Bacilli bacterium]|nr:hypothetical protein [Bacilli bacterium]